YRNLEPGDHIGIGVDVSQLGRFNSTAHRCPAYFPSPIIRTILRHRKVEPAGVFQNDLSLARFGLACLSERKARITRHLITKCCFAKPHRTPVVVNGDGSYYLKTSIAERIPPFVTADIYLIFF